jgi:hypothetical protein
MPTFKVLAACQSAFLTFALVFSLAAIPASANHATPVVVAFERVGQTYMSPHPHLQHVQTCLPANAKCGSEAACKARCCSKAWYDTKGGCSVDRNGKSVCDNTSNRKCG